jgi:hypothetical protein
MPRMKWLSRHAWWGLAAIAVLFALFGVTDILSGAAADPAIATALTGKSLSQLQAEGGDAYQLYDFAVRQNGWTLMLVGGLLLAILVFGFRRNQRWAWWAMWALPVWSVGVMVFFVVTGTEPSQPPAPPMISGPIVAVVSAAILLVSGPRFFGPPPPAKWIHLDT